MASITPNVSGKPAETTQSPYFNLNYNKTSNLFNKEGSFLKRVASKTASFVVAIFETLQNALRGVANGFIGVGRGIKSLFTKKTVTNETAKPTAKETPKSEELVTNKNDVVAPTSIVEKASTPVETVVANAKPTSSEFKFKDPKNERRLVEVPAKEEVVTTPKTEEVTVSTTPTLKEQAKAVFNSAKDRVTGFVKNNPRATFVGSAAILAALAGSAMLIRSEGAHANSGILYANPSTDLYPNLLGTCANPGFMNLTSSYFNATAQYA